MADFVAKCLADHIDVWAPEATEEVGYTHHRFKTPVHSLPDGFIKFKKMRVSSFGKNKFSWREAALDAWIGNRSTL